MTDTDGVKMSNEYKFIQDSEVKLSIFKYLSKELEKAGFSRIEIQKTPVITRIAVHVLNPGRVIGRSGKSINDLTDSLKSKFNVSNPQISVIEVQNRMLEPLLVAKDLAFKLERSMNPRKIMEYTLRNIMDNGAVGAEIIISGKLAAKGARGKTIKKSVGYIPKAGDVTNLVDEGTATAYPKYGAIGVLVRIVPPGTVFPDKIKHEEVSNITMSKESGEPGSESETEPELEFPEGSKSDKLEESIDKKELKEEEESTKNAADEADSSNADSDNTSN